MLWKFQLKTVATASFTRVTYHERAYQQPWASKYPDLVNGDVPGSSRFQQAEHVCKLSYTVVATHMMKWMGKARNSTCSHCLVLPHIVQASLNAFWTPSNAKDTSEIPKRPYFIHWIVRSCWSCILWVHLRARWEHGWDGPSEGKGKL